MAKQVLLELTSRSKLECRMRLLEFLVGDFFFLSFLVLLELSGLLATWPLVHMPSIVALATSL